MKPLSCNAVILVCDLIDKSHLDNTLTLGDILGIDLANKLKFPFLGAKCLCGVFYRKKVAKINWDIGTLMNWKF